MTTNIKDGQWTITTVEVFSPTAIKTNFSPREEWIQFTKKHKYKPTIANQDRFFCGCCKTPWGEAEGTYVHLVTFKTRANKVICDKCAKQLIEQGVKTI